MNFISFGSGSSGNCYYLIDEGFGLLIDQGIGLRHLKKHLNAYGLPQSQVRAMLVTHDHTDHVKAVGLTSAEFAIPVYASEAVHAGMQRNYLMSKKIPQAFQRVLNPGQTVEVGPFRVSAFAVPHDASGNSGYFVETADTNLCLMTDCGAITPEMTRFIGKARNLVIEANYDTAMLLTGPYPEHLKRRIQSGTGHSSNAETAAALAAHLSPEAERVWLCHLSEENNHPELCRHTIGEALRDAGLTPQFDVLKRRVPSALYTL